MRGVLTLNPEIVPGRWPLPRRAGRPHGELVTSAVTSIDALYKVRKGELDIITVPELGYVAVEGRGDPQGPEFAAAIQALYSVSYGAHFLVRKRDGQAPRVMPLEALWWAGDDDPQDVITALALGSADLAGVDRDQWRWRAMIMQPSPIDGDVAAEAVAQARAKPVPALDRLRYGRWEEGLSAQVLHIGPYSAEAPSIVRLHEGIAAAGYRPRGRHHEIYLGDPRRSAPERLRTILRHPVEPG
jgi:hypothetical protein